MSDHDHDEHDLGLLHDLQTMRARWALLPQMLSRRNALRLFGAAGAGFVLAACGGDTKKNNAAGTSTTGAADATTTTAGASAGATTTVASSGGGSATDNVARAPSETGGPYPADGTNGPNVLNESGVVRQDMTKSFGQYSGSTSGVPLTVNLKIVKANGGGAYAGAALYLWHCTADGLYSLYSQGATDQNFCRAVQAADSSGNLTFKTVFPGCYAGRWPHFHYEVFPSLSAASASNRLLTSQIALPQDACEAVYADASKYPGSARNLQQLSLQSDGVFRDSYQSQMGAVTGSASSGFTMTYTVGV